MIGAVLDNPGAQAIASTLSFVVDEPGGGRFADELRPRSSTPPGRSSQEWLLHIRSGAPTGSYRYAVGAHQESGGALSEMSGSFTVSPARQTPPDTDSQPKQPPTASPTGPIRPTGVIATTLSETSIQVSWRDESLDETGFRLWMNDKVRARTVPSNTTVAKVNGLKPGEIYCFQVEAFNQAASSGLSEKACQETLAPGQPVPPSNNPASDPEAWQSFLMQVKNLGVGGACLGKIVALSVGFPFWPTGTVQALLSPECAKTLLNGGAQGWALIECVKQYPLKVCVTPRFKVATSPSGPPVVVRGSTRRTRCTSARNLQRTYRDRVAWDRSHARQAEKRSRLYWRARLRHDTVALHHAAKLVARIC